MPERDLALLLDAAEAAGRLALHYRETGFETREKPGLGPVTDADIAVDDMLRAELRAARPDYGWLSEETPDSPDRLGDRLAATRVFLIDPIDGTRDFIGGGRSWGPSLAIAEAGRLVAGVVHLPALGRSYAAARGQGATRDGMPLTAGDRAEVTGARVLASATALAPAAWTGPPPPLTRSFRPSLAYRLCLVAEGAFDATLTFRDSWEWDIAAGALIVMEAGARASDSFGAPLRFNGPSGLLPGLIAAGPRLHAALVGQRPRPGATPAGQPSDPAASA